MTLLTTKGTLFLFNNSSCIEDYKNGKRLYYLKIDVNIMMNIRKQPYLVFREDYGATSKNEI